MAQGRLQGEQANETVSEKLAAQRVHAVPVVQLSQLAMQGRQVEVLR